MYQKILNALPGNHPWQTFLKWESVTDSTNSQAKGLATQGAPHGTVLVADSQTGGRGRMGRSFVSPPGMGVYLSVILRPNCPPDKLMHLTCAAAEAMCNALEEAAGFRPGIKWTNDLVFDSRKLGGILTELSISSQSGLVDYAVVGVGINCCQQLRDFPDDLQSMAGSLSMVTGKAVDRARVAAAMIKALYEMDRDLFQNKEALMNAYRKDCITLGQQIVLVRDDRRSYGTAVDLHDDGGLVVAFDDGTTGTVTSGEVSVRGMYGYV